MPDMIEVRRENGDVERMDIETANALVRYLYDVRMSLDEQRCALADEIAGLTARIGELERAMKGIRPPS